MESQRAGVDEHKALLYVLRHPRGVYPIERAAQLSGVPRSTLYDWRQDNATALTQDRRLPIRLR